jgi:hypothetical protein
MKKLTKNSVASSFDEISRRDHEDTRGLPPEYSKIYQETKADKKLTKNTQNLQIISKNSPKPMRKPRKLLKYLTTTSFTLNKSRHPPTTSPFKLKTIRTLTTTHLKLCETLKTINLLFLLANACFVALNLIAMIFVLFQIFVVTRSTVKKSARQMNNLVLSTSWNLLMATKVAIVTGVCAATVREGVKPERILNEILGCERDDVVAGRARIFVQQLKHVRPNFSCGLFEFNLGLICMVRILDLFYFFNI